jgi:hypothetical protein
LDGHCDWLEGRNALAEHAGTVTRCNRGIARYNKGGTVQTAFAPDDVVQFCIRGFAWNSMHGIEFDSSRKGKSKKMS